MTHWEFGRRIISKEWIRVNDIGYTLEYFKVNNIDFGYMYKLLDQCKWEEFEAYVVMLKLNDEIISYYKD